VLNRRREAVPARELARECLDAVADEAAALRCEANSSTYEGLLDYLVQETSRMIEYRHQGISLRSCYDGERSALPKAMMT
jgi:hypothetical protein